MSARFYPRFVQGNPQLRVFLPDWKLILVKPLKPMPDNVVCFKTDPRMTDWDIKNYLQKIYKVQVAAINSRILAGPLKSISQGKLTKGYDYRIAHVTLPIGQTFKWPDLYPQDKFKEELTEYDKTLKEISKNRQSDPHVKDVPTWFL